MKKALLWWNITFLFIHSAKGEGLWWLFPKFSVEQQAQNETVTRIITNKASHQADDHPIVKSLENNNEDVIFLEDDSNVFSDKYNGLVSTSKKANPESIYSKRNTVRNDKIMRKKIKADEHNNDDILLHDDPFQEEMNEESGSGIDRNQNIDEEDMVGEFNGESRSGEPIDDLLSGEGKRYERINFRTNHSETTYHEKNNPGMTYIKRTRSETYFSNINLSEKRDYKENATENDTEEQNKTVKTKENNNDHNLAMHILVDNDDSGSGGSKETNRERADSFIGQQEIPGKIILVTENKSTRMTTGNADTDDEDMIQEESSGGSATSELIETGDVKVDDFVREVIDPTNVLAERETHNQVITGNIGKEDIPSVVDKKHESSAKSGFTKALGQEDNIGGRENISEETDFDIEKETIKEIEREDTITGNTKDEDSFFDNGKNQEETNGESEPRKKTGMKRMKDFNKDPKENISNQLSHLQSVSPLNKMEPDIKANEDRITSISLLEEDVKGREYPNKPDVIEPSSEKGKDNESGTENQQGSRITTEPVTYTTSNVNNDAEYPDDFNTESNQQYPVFPTIKFDKCHEQYGRHNFTLEIIPNNVRIQEGSDVQLNCRLICHNDTTSPSTLNITWVFEDTSCLLGEDKNPSRSVDLQLHSFDAGDSEYNSSLLLSKIAINQTGRYICKVDVFDCSKPGNLFSLNHTANVAVYDKPNYGVHIAVTSTVCLLLIVIMICLLFLVRKKRKQFENRYQELLTTTKITCQPIKVLELPPNIHNATTITGKTAEQRSNSSFSGDDVEDP